jgi:hypothetical protein
MLGQFTFMGLGMMDEGLDLAISIQTLMATFEKVSGFTNTNILVQLNLNHSTN